MVLGALPASQRPSIDRPRPQPEERHSPIVQSERQLKSQPVSIERNRSLEVVDRQMSFEESEDGTATGAYSRPRPPRPPVVAGIEPSLSNHRSDKRVQGLTSGSQPR